MKTLITTAVLFTGLAWSRGPHNLDTPHNPRTRDHELDAVGYGLGLAFLF